MKFMVKPIILGEVEGKLISLDDKIDNISDYISDYKNMTGTPEGFPELPMISDPGESLFDGMFQSIIQNFNSNIRSSSEEAASFNLILENTSDAVIELDEGNRILKVNPACLAIFEYREAELLGKSIYDIISEAYHESFKKRLEDPNSFYPDQW